MYKRQLVAHYDFNSGDGTILFDRSGNGNDGDIDGATWVDNGVSDLGAIFTYSPNENYNGTDSFTFWANDGMDDSNVATVSITVDPVNDPPTSSNLRITIPEDTEVTDTMLAEDIEDDALTYIIAEDPDHGTVTSMNSSTGEFTYMPDENYTGNDKFFFYVNDGEYDSDTSRVRFRMEAVNDDPVLAYMPDTSTYEDVTLVVPLIATDGDDTELEITVSSSNDSVYLELNDDMLVMEPYPGWHGTSEISVLIDDNLPDGDVVDSAMVIESIPFDAYGSTEGYFDNYDEVCPYNNSVSPDVVYAYTASEDMVVDIDLCGSMYDTKVYVYENEVGNLALTTDGEEACDDDFYGYDTLETGCGAWTSAIWGVQLHAGNTYYVVVDGWSGDYGEYELMIYEVEEELTDLTGDWALNYDWDCTGFPNTAEIYFDADGSFTTSDDGNGTWSGSSGSVVLEAGDGCDAITFDFNATFTFTGGSLSYFLDVDGSDANGPMNHWETQDAHGGDHTMSRSSRGNTYLSGTGTNTYGAMAGANENIIPEYTDLTDMPWVTFDDPDRTNHHVYDPNALEMKMRSLEERMANREPGGGRATDSQVFTLTVHEVNDPPVAYGDGDEYWMSEDDTLFFTMSGDDGDYLPLYEDVQSLIYSVVSDAEHGDVTIDPETGAVVYDPHQDYFGPDNVVFAVTDDGTTAGAADPLSDNATVFIEVGPVNDDPVLAFLPDTSMNEDGSLGLGIFAVDVDNMDLTIDAWSANGYVSAEMFDTLLVITPDENWNGSTDITVVVSDNMSRATDSQSFMLTVLPVNDAPFFTMETFSASVSMTDHLSIDLHGDDIDSDIFFSLSGHPGWLSVDGDRMVGQPDADSVYVFGLSVSDGELAVTEEYVLSVADHRPGIVDLSDVPEDQGRQMQLSWVPGNPGEWGYFTEFSLWRHVAGTENVWDFVNTVPWHGFEPYSAVVPTLGDSTHEGITWSTFRVTGHTEDPNSFYHSEPVTGYSTDDLAPLPPTGVMAEQVDTSIVVTWDLPVDEDFDYFSLHRSTEPDFSVNAENLLSHTLDTMATDTDVEWFVTYYYKLTATDFSGNTGEPSNEAEALVYVNLAPTISAIGDTSTDEDMPISIEVSVSDENEGDTLTVSASSSDEGVMPGVDGTTISLDLEDDWNGSAEITVLVSDGELADSTSFTLTVNAVNDAPGAFTLISPPDSSEIVITEVDIAQNATIDVSWEESIDVDEDEISYGFVLYAGPYTAVTPTFVDTLVMNNELSIPYAAVLAVMTAAEQSYISCDWTVYSTDGVDTTSADTVWTVTLDARGILDIDDDLIPETFALHQNYPNPFNPETTIRYDLPESENVQIMIYDLMGRQIRTLVSEHQEAGYRLIRWDALNDRGQGVSAGMYIYTIQAGEFREVKKMVLLK